MIDTQEVYRFDPAAPPDLGPASRVVWVAPGSSREAGEALARQWPHDTRLSSLQAIPGAWAAVLWDGDRRRYLAAKDAVGVQPLFWSEADSGEIVVASWLAQLLDQPDVREQRDYDAILLSLCAFDGGEATLFQSGFVGVEAVPWGRVRAFPIAGSPTYERYWYPEDIAVDNNLTVADSVEMIGAAVAAAVERALSDHLPTGSHISGGLDCSAVALKAQQLLAAKGETLVAGYSWSPPPHALEVVENDERIRVAEVAEAAGVPVRWWDPDSDVAWFLNRDPIRYPQTSLVWERHVLPQAHTDGVRVMLSGWGGDELASFNGAGLMTTLIRQGQIGQAWRMADPAPWKAPKGQRMERARVFAAAAWQARPDLRRRLPDRRDADRRRALALLRGEYPAVADALLENIKRSRGPKDGTRYQVRRIGNGHLQRRTMAWYQAGRLFDLTYRYPLLDLEVVQTALTLPPRAFRSPEWSRIAFRRAVAKWTPASVVWNPKKRDSALFHETSLRKVSQLATKEQLGDQLEEIHLLAREINTLVW